MDKHAHWGYKGEIGPEFWYKLDPAYAIARDGKAQSPVNIEPAGLTRGTEAELPVFRYTSAAFSVWNNGHSIELRPRTAGDAGLLMLDGIEYSLVQAHFHAPSEHAIDGALADMEIHLVHSDKAGNIVVAGLLVKQGAENMVLQEAFERLPPVKTEFENRSILQLPLNMALIFQGQSAFYRYKGSLTTPPCSENIEWVLGDRPVELSAKQLASFRALYNGNNRPLQPLHGRSIRVVKA
jgi:carbonic anhydrase